ncbi:MAG: Crp/Fnr family transcriptional regulator [Ferruginibacter sp.]
MNQTSLINFLKNTSQLGDNAATAIAKEFEYKELTKGELFLKAGKVADEYLFLESGFIRSYLFDTEGDEVTINFYSKNELVFEVASFFQRVPSQEYFEATTSCTGWFLTYEKLNLLFHSLPEFRDYGRSVLVKGFTSFKLRTLSLINKTAEERYELLINSNPDIFRNVPLKNIASYLGVTDSSLSRIRKSFTRK